MSGYNLEPIEYEAAVESFLDDVYRLALSITRSEADAWDVSQNVFLKLSQSNKEFESRSHLKNWLLKTTANESRSLLRTWFRRNVRADIDTVPDLPVKEQEDYEQLMNALARLKKIDRAIVVLFYWQKLDQKTIGDMLKMSPGTVSTRLHRARNKLREWIEEEEQSDEN